MKSRMLPTALLTGLLTAIPATMVMATPAWGADAPAKLALASLPAPAVQKVHLGIFNRAARIGASIQPGAAGYDAASGVYRVTGGGENIWAANDAFYFVYRKLKGDFTLSADVRFVGSGGNPHRKAVLMARQSLDSGAAYADAAAHGVGLTALQYRLTPGAQTEEIVSPANGPEHFRFTRRGDEFTMAVSNDGSTWTTSGPVKVPLGRSLLVGLGVCAHDPQAMLTVEFSNVRLSK